MSVVLGCNSWIKNFSAQAGDGGFNKTEETVHFSFPHHHNRGKFSHWLPKEAPEAVLQCSLWEKTRKFHASTAVHNCVFAINLGRLQTLSPRNFDCSLFFFEAEVMPLENRSKTFFWGLLWAFMKLWNIGDTGEILSGAVMIIKDHSIRILLHCQPAAQIFLL